MNQKTSKIRKNSCDFSEKKMCKESIILWDCEILLMYFLIFFYCKEHISFSLNEMFQKIGNMFTNITAWEIIRTFSYYLNKLFCSMLDFMFSKSVYSYTFIISAIIAVSIDFYFEDLKSKNSGSVTFCEN